MARVEIEATVHEDPPLAGMKTEWVGATDEASGIEARLSTGAGLGNPYLEVAVTAPGGLARWVTVDIREVLPLLIDVALEGDDG